MAKQVYATSNRKDEYAQITDWLDQREKVLQHAKFIRRCINASDPNYSPIQLPPASLIPHCTLCMTKHPTLAAVTVERIENKYGARYFRVALSRFVVQNQHPDLDKAQIRRVSSQLMVETPALKVHLVSVDLTGPQYSLNCS